MQSKCLFLAVAAGSVLAVNAFAQTEQLGLQASPVNINQIHGGGYLRDGGYGQRIDLEVFQIGVPAETGGVFAGSGTNVYDDANFAGPYTSNANPLALNGMSTGFILPAVFPAVNGQHLYTAVSFYPNHDNAAAATTYPYSGTPVVAALDWGDGWTDGATPGSVRYYATSITFGGTIATLTNADVFNGGATDRLAGVKIEPYNDAAFTVRATEYQVVRRAGFAGWKVGSGDTWGWFSTAPTVASGELMNSERSGGGALAVSVMPNVNTGNCRATYMGFQGTGFGVSEPASTTLGTLTDAGSNQNSITVPNGGVTWYNFTITNGAIDGNQAFLDLDTEGSAADLAIAVYDGNTAALTYGNVARFDQDDGSGLNAQLSFGMGRRAAVGDGRQYDGRDFYNGAAGLAAGRYLIAVAPANTSFANGFSVTPGPTGGSGQLHIRTNVNGTPLAPSVLPPIAPGDDLMPNPLTNPGAQIPLVAMDNDMPRFVTFTTCQAADDANPVTLDWSGSSTAGFSATLFTSAGNLYFQSIQPGAGQPANIVFNSSNPLPAGSYYLALSYAGVQVQPNSPDTNGRFHIRSTTGNNGFATGGGVLVNNDACGAVCGTADFDGDGDVGTDADIEAFFACLGGNCCATCFPGGADFNGDGDTGTDADIEAFFRVLSGGNC